MGRYRRRIALALCTVLTGLALGTWHVAFRPPQHQPLPLPASLTAWATPAGQRLRDPLYQSDLDGLLKHFEAQSRPAFCGVASSVIVLNALQQPRPLLTQSTFFDGPAGQVKGSIQVSLEGMTLAQLTGLLQAHGVQATRFHASQTDVQSFRSMLKRNLGTAGDFMLVNYQRAMLGQVTGGHISPLAAYNASTDQALILDVAAYKYPPVWVPTETLWRAMNTVDDATGLSRGFVMVRRREPPGL